MAKKVFTDSFIKNLRYPQVDPQQGGKRRQPIDKREADGFGIRLYPAGEKTWFYIYTIEGKRRFFNLGHYPFVSLADARDKHREAKKLVELGMDPAAVAENQKEARRLEPTVAELADEYMEKHAKRNKKSWKDDEYMLNKDILPAWGHLKASTIRKRDVVLLIETIFDRGAPIQSNRVRSLIVKMFSFGVDRDLLQASPSVGVKKLASENARDRVLSEDEIRTFWHGLYNPDIIMSDLVKRMLKLVLVTAQRPGEVAGMHSLEIEGRWWTIPPERSKNGEEARVYLSDLAMELIGSIKEGYIFESPKTKPGDHEAAVNLAMSHGETRDTTFKNVAAYGVATHNGAGHIRSMSAIMADAKQTIMDMERSADQDAASKSIFGKSWEEAQKIVGTENRHITANAMAVALTRNIKKYNPGKKNYQRGPYKNKTPDPVERNRLGVEPFRPHDLRRTASTCMGELDIRESIIERILNHKRRDGVAWIYNRYAYDPQKQKALESWSRRLSVLVSAPANMGGNIAL
jgi:integrase